MVEPIAKLVEKSTESVKELTPPVAAERPVIDTPIVVNVVEKPVKTVAEPVPVINVISELQAPSAAKPNTAVEVAPERELAIPQESAVVTAELSIPITPERPVMPIITQSEVIQAVEPTSTVDTRVAEIQSETVVATSVAEQTTRAFEDLHEDLEASGDGDASEISDADLDAVISQWMIEYNTGIPSSPLGIAPSFEAEIPVDEVSIIDAVGNTELSPMQISDVEINNDDRVMTEALPPTPADIAPAVELTATQLVTHIEMLEPEVVAEVHQLLDEVIQEIEQLERLIDNLSSNISELPNTALEGANIAVADNTTIEAPLAVATSDEALLPLVDIAPLEASLQRLFIAAGLDYSPEEVHALALQLLSSGDNAELNADSKPSNIPASADWGTRESLQWFVSQLRNQRRQTNSLHRLADVVGRYALSTLHEMQPA